MDRDHDEWVAAIVEAIKTGTGLDLTPGEAVDPQQADSWPPSRQLPGEALRAALLQPDVTPDPRGLRIRAAHVTAEADLADLRIGHSLKFEYCAFEQPLDWSRITTSGSLGLYGCAMSSLTLDNAEIKGSVFLGNLTATGEVRAVAATIGGQLDLEDANLTNEGGVALNLDSAEIKGAAFLENLTATGEVWAVAATVGELELDDANLTNEGGLALRLDTVRLRRLSLAPASIKGGVGLAGAQIDLLAVPENMNVLTANDLNASGWRLQDVHGAIRRDRRAAADWLTSTGSGKDSEFVAQPWHELANVYDRNGQPADARWLRWSAARGVTRTSPWSSKPIRWIYGALTGHGYYSLVAALWLILAVLMTVGIVATNRTDFAPTATNRAAWGPDVPLDQSTQPITGATPCDQLKDPSTCLNPVLWSFDNVLPGTLATGQAGLWTPNGARGWNQWVPYTLGTLKLLSWILVALLLAGITGLLRKT
jgi:hypothetical protein